MSFLSTDGANSLVDDFLSLNVNSISLHTAFSISGGSEVTGGSPTYSRQVPAWAAASSRTADNSGDITFNVPTATTVSFVGFWDSAGGPDFKGMVPVNSTFGAVMNFDFSTNNIEYFGHPLADDDRVVIFGLGTGSVPTGLTEGTIYYVVNAGLDTFQVSTTSGGAAVSFSTNGQALVMNGSPITTTSQTTLTLATGTLDVTAFV